MPESELLEKVQKRCLKYFWDNAHPISKLTKERIHVSNMELHKDMVTVGGSGFGLLNVIMGIEREYFKDGTDEEKLLSKKADKLWKEVEWNWYTKGENTLYWHWSPEFEWQINFKIEGYNESLMPYILGAASPTFPINEQVFHEGWANNGNILSSATQYGIATIFDHKGSNQNVGPLFWAHYSFLTLDPRGLSDIYANYWKVVKNHTEIIYQHCISNPNGYLGYSDNCWGLTASYSQLFWNLFMNAPEIKVGLEKLGFSSTYYDLSVSNKVNRSSYRSIPCHRTILTPFNPSTQIQYVLPGSHLLLLRCSTA